MDVRIPAQREPRLIVRSSAYRAWRWREAGCRARPVAALAGVVPHLEDLVEQWITQVEYPEYHTPPCHMRRSTVAHAASGLCAGLSTLSDCKKSSAPVTAVFALQAELLFQQTEEAFEDESFMR